MTLGDLFPTLWVLVSVTALTRRPVVLLLYLFLCIVPFYSHSHPVGPAPSLRLSAERAQEAGSH